MLVRPSGLYFGENRKVVFGKDTVDTINGGLNTDRLYGGGGNDTINGYDGNDYIEGGKGKDTITGGKGDDLIIASTYVADNYLSIDKRRNVA